MGGDAASPADPARPALKLRTHRPHTAVRPAKSAFGRDATLAERLALHNHRTPRGRLMEREA
jgi:hypothetical protein